MNIKIAVSVIIGLSAYVTAYPWANPGHMAVAGIAYDELSTSERSKVVTIMQHHPDLGLITEGFPGGIPDDRAFFMAAATWPDRSKQSKEYANNGYEEHEPAVTSVKFDKKMHKGYHFIDTPLWLGQGPTPQLPEVPKVNAVGVVNVLVSQLHSNEDGSAKAYDLFWLLHLVGDLHQPLHAVSGVTDTYPDGDVGGNRVKLVEVKGETELHAFWDDIPGKSAKADRKTHLPRLDKDVETADSFIELARKASLGSNATSGNLDPAAWAAESYEIAKQDVYDIDLSVSHSGDNDTLQAHIDEDYSTAATKDAKKRVHLAGHRLALILKQILQ